MTRSFTDRRCPDVVADRAVVYIGAMGANIQKLNLTAAAVGSEKLWGRNDYLVISRPR